MTAARYTVTRLPGAPARRAGRAWALGETLALRLSPDQVAALAADPGYTIAPVATGAGIAPAFGPPGAGPDEDGPILPAPSDTALKPTQARRSRTKG